MSLTIKKLSPITQLTASTVTQYTVPAATTTRITELLLCNADTVERTVTINFVASAGSVTAANRVISTLPIPASTTKIIPLNTVMSAGDFISALASAATAVNLQISGTEIV